jgi:hypothetical protein
MIETLKEFVEISFCEEQQVISELQPYQLRLLSKVQDANDVLPPRAWEEQPKEELEVRDGSE